MKRLSNQEWHAAHIMARDAQRKRNAREWMRRAGEADDAGDWALADRLFRQSLLEWPAPGLRTQSGT